MRLSFGHTLSAQCKPNCFQVKLQRLTKKPQLLQSLSTSGLAQDEEKEVKEVSSLSGWSPAEGRERFQGQGAAGACPDVATWQWAR